MKEKKMRLDKYLSSFTQLSRKEAKKAIRSGRVFVEGEPVGKEDARVGLHQKIVWEGNEVEAEENLYYMLNKPAGVLSAVTDKKERTVRELILDTNRDIFPVGRLDKDTEGLLFLTDDGMLAHRLLSPAYHVEKIYYVEYEGCLLPDAAPLFLEGLDIGERKITGPARLELSQEGKALLTISEGKYHQVKRMFARVGGRVTYLKRISMAGVALDEKLMPGKYRQLTAEEINRLKKAAQRERSDRRR